MIVTIVCDVLGKENNGTTIAAMNLIRSLRSKGHEVRVICADEERRGQDGFYIVSNYSFGKFLDNYVEKNGVKLAKPDMEIMEAAIRDCDVVHVMVPFALGITARRLAQKYDKALTAGFHCQAENFTSHLALMNFKFANRMTYKFFYGKMYRYCDCVHYPSQFICDVFEKSTKPTNHYIISNGVNNFFIRQNIPKPSELRDKFIILFTGRYSREKSHAVLINAVGLSKYNDKIQLIFAGDGPLKDKLKQLSEEKLANQPVFKFYSREELLNVINYSDLYVHPAEIEIEAIACLEAITCGLVPVIADSPRCATKYFALSDKNLFKVNDSENLKDKIEYWIEHPEERKKNSEKYQGYTTQFEQETCMDKMEKMLVDAYKKKN